MKIKYILTILCFLIITSFCNTSYAATLKEGINNFPNAYKPYLQELQKRHPNWKFIALYTNLDWTYAVNNENVFGKNLVPKSYSDRWKNTKKR